MIWKSLFFIFYFSQTIFCLNEIRWCTVSDKEKKKCDNMKATFAEAKIVPSLSCVEGTSPLNCIKLVKDNKADAVTVSGILTYKAGRWYNLKPVVGEVYDQGAGTSYYAVAVVRKNSSITINSLEGTKSCHTGYEKTSGWNVPIGYLLDSGRMSAVACDIPKGVSQFFSKSCVPGAENLNASLCDLCKGNGSSVNQCGKDMYQDYNGAFRCLVDGGDVAFVKHSTVLDNSDGKNSDSWPKDILSSDYQLLCRDGTHAEVTEWKRCNLARVPANAVVVRSDMDGSLIYKMLHEGQQTQNPSFKMFDSAAYEGKNLLFRDATTELRLISNQTYQSWLGDEFLQAMTGIDCDRDKLPKSLRWCSFSTEEIWKCGDMAIAFKNKTLSPPIQCVSAVSREDCMKLIQQKEADAVSLYGEDIYKAGKTYQLVPAAVESYANDVSDNYYAVAVVKKTTQDSFTFHELKGRKSCHSEYMQSAGWNIPIGLLTRKGLIRPEGCNIDRAVSEFFSESCVPGANEKDSSSKLCQLCKGNGSVGSECQNNSKEQYYGDSGAFRCVAKDGDVAFVKHSTVFENSDGNNIKDEWAKNLKSSDFQLLCPNGARAEVTQYADCNWAQVPAHAVMVHPEMNIQTLFGLLDKAQEYYGRNKSSVFQMFDSSKYNKKDLIFKDSTDKIVPVNEKKSYDQLLGRNYIDSIEGFQCTSSAAITPVNTALLLISNIFLIKFCA
ncbi:melanotransferrin-like [Bufo gargarizans]|uniref:melanotransferrin-like n=1 Tax=Bufo gargarizans TaxID=30331 RepID=UPI001CF46649|nr:melanotransferrin-like [Bufo gargarizans]